MKRVPTGIPGLDDLVEGGFLEGSTTLVAAGTGCGKTIFSMQYLYNGAKDYNEPGVFISLEEGPTNLWWNVQRFKWDLPTLERQNLLKIFKLGIYEPQEFSERLDEELGRISDLVKEMGAKRLVLDSVSAMSLWIEKPGVIRYTIYRISEELKKLKCTSLFTCEVLGGKNAMSRFGVEEFVADGVIRLYFMPPNRALFVRKMRGTNHDKKVHPFEITDEGIKTDAKEEIIWEAIKD